MVKHSSVTGVLELSRAPTTDLDLVRIYDLPCFLFANKMTVDLEMAFWRRALRIKPNNIIAVFFFFFSKILFNYAIQESVVYNFPPI